MRYRSIVHCAIASSMMPFSTAILHRRHQSHCEHHATLNRYNHGSSVLHRTSSFSRSVTCHGSTCFFVATELSLSLPRHKGRFRTDPCTRLTHDVFLFSLVCCAAPPVSASRRYQWFDGRPTHRPLRPPSHCN
jgi:hypothetical protein